MSFFNNDQTLSLIIKPINMNLGHIYGSALMVTKTRQYLKRCNLDEHNLVVHCDYINELRETTIAILAHNKLSYSNELFIQGQLYYLF